MPRYDPSTGKVIEGEAPATTLVPVISPDGQPDAVLPDRVKAMLELGYQLDTPEYRAQLEQKAKYGNRPGAAAAAGAARSLTFGASDLVADKTGLVDSETLKGLAEQNEDATTAGEIGALLVPGLGGLKALGAAGKVAKGIGAGLEAASGVGRAVEGLGATAAEALGINEATTLGRIAGTYIPRAAGVAAEAQLYDIGHNLSQAVLNDEDLTAEALMAHSGNALAVGSALGLGAPALRRAGRELFDRVVPDVVRNTASAIVSKAARSAADQVAKFFDPDRSLQLFSGAMQKELRQETGARFQAAVRGLREKGFYRSGDVAADLETGGFKRLAEGELPSQEGALARLNKSQDQIGEAVRTTLQDVDAAIGQDALKLGKDGAWEVGTPLEAKKIYKFQREFKAAVGDIAPARLQEMRTKITHMLKNGVIDEAQAQGLQNTLQWGRSLIQSKQGSLSGLQDLKLGLSQRIKAKNFESMGSPEVEMLKDLRRVVKENIEYGVELVKNEQRYKGLANKVASVGKLNETWGQLEQIRAPLDRAIARSEANVNVGGLRWRDMLAGVGGSSVGGAVAGPAGAVAGAGLGLVNKALQTDRGLLLRASIGEQFGALLGANKALQNVRGAITDGARQFVTRKALPAAERTIKQLGPRTTTQGVMFIEDRAAADNRHHDKEQRYQAQVRQLAQLVNNPDQTADTLARATQQLDHVSSAVRDKVIAKKMQAYSYLLNKAPKDPLSQFMPNPAHSHYHPADGEIQLWNRHMRAAVDPFSIIDDIHDGTVTPEAVETVQTLYPRLYAELQGEIMNHVAASEEPLPYSDRVQLGLLFNVPTDASLTPAFMQAIAETSGGAPSDAEPKGGARAAGASKMKSDDMATRTEELV